MGKKLTTSTKKSPVAPLNIRESYIARLLTSLLQRKLEGLEYYAGKDQDHVQRLIREVDRYIEESKVNKGSCRKYTLKIVEEEE